MNFSQLGGFIRYEFLMQWRRRALLGLMLGLAVVPIVMVIFFGESNVAEIRQAWITAGGVETEVVRDLTTRNVLTSTSTALYVVMLLMLPVIAADSVPKDRQLGVHELLASLPLTAGNYLLGKLLGFWVSATVGAAGAMIIAGVGLWFLLGPFQIDQYVMMWGITLLGVGLINSGLSLLLAAGQPTRRRAIFIGVTFAVVCMLSNIAGFGQSSVVGTLFNPGRWTITSYYFFKALLDSSWPQLVPEQDVVLALIGGVAELITIGGLAWLGLRRRETST